MYAHDLQKTDLSSDVSFHVWYLYYFASRLIQYTDNFNFTTCVQNVNRLAIRCRSDENPEIYINNTEPPATLTAKYNISFTLKYSKFAIKKSRVCLSARSFAQNIFQSTNINNFKTLRLFA